MSLSCRLGNGNQVDDVDFVAETISGFVTAAPHRFEAVPFAGLQLEDKRIAGWQDMETA